MIKPTVEDLSKVIQILIVHIMLKSIFEYHA